MTNNNANALDGLTLTAEQNRAVELACKRRIVVVTGGPGTGKTTVCRQVLNALEHKQSLTVKCAAPTGKAAKRFAEQTSRRATTIHRLLEWSPVMGGGFTRNENNPLECDAVIIDESSMVDLRLFRDVLVALPEGCRLVLVGDVDQLPSIGPGHVLRDVIDSGAVPVVRLTQIHRQSPNSWISTNAARLNTGQKPHIDNDASDDFWFWHCDAAQDAADRMVELVTKTIPESTGLDPVRDVQVLCPQWKSAVGVEFFNAELQRLLNPPREYLPEWKIGDKTLRQRDKVIHTRNNYTLGAFNGEVGIVADIAQKDLIVDFGDRRVVYGKEDAQQLQLCYATTIHKSQGSEYPCVVVPVHSTNHHMISRPLIYTAITRGKRYVHLVGNPKGLRRAYSNADVARRNTFLDQRLEQGLRG